MAGEFILDQNALADIDNPHLKKADRLELSRVLPNTHWHPTSVELILPVLVASSP